MAYITPYVGKLLLYVTLVGAAHAAWRRRDPRRLDIFYLLSALLVRELLRGDGELVGAFRTLLNCLLPFFLLRLVRHFRLVPLSLMAAAGFAGIAGPLLFLFIDGRTRNILMSIVFAYVAAQCLYAALVFFLQSRRAAGVASHRLRFAAGSALFAAVAFGFGSSSELTHSVSRIGGKAIQQLYGGMYIGFFFSFATPRWLLAWWQRTEQAAFLTRVMARDPETRGRLAAEDLFDAAQRSVGSGTTIVATRSSPNDASLVIRAASDAALVGQAITPQSGTPFGRAALQGEATAGAATACEPELAPRLASLGSRVLVAPVGGHGHSWGVVATVQRRGALFPEDDLASLAHLGAYAATALDHAQLLLERRDRAQRAADRRLREVETRTSLMLDSLTDYAMFVLDDDGRVAAWHAGAEQLFGYTPDQIRDQNASVIYGMSTSDFAGWLGEARQHGLAERECVCHRRGGTTFLGATTCRPLAGDRDELPGFVVVTRDVTVQRDLEDRLRQSQKMEAIGQLAGGIAHDFNNLLTAIVGYADMLERELHGDPRRGQVAEIQKAAERASDLTRQLLSFSRRQMLQPAAIDLTYLVRDLLPMLHRLIGEQIEIVDATAPTQASILGDRSQVEQVILNLVLNARDAMPSGGRLTIRTGAVWLDGSPAFGELEGPHVVLEVADTGVGMDESTRRRVFEPFFTTKDVGSGTGLGLSTVYGIVQQMGGTVQVESEMHRGTTFRLFFPESSGSETGAEPLASAPTARGGHETILLVEDDEAARTYHRHVLETQGYRVLTAQHAAEAIAIARSTDVHPDLVISDVVMPGGSGPELVKTLLETRPNLSVLYISGPADSAMAPSRGDTPPHLILIKPFSLADLLARIRQILSAS